MFGRIFGRGKDEPEQAVCAKCGRTLLAGEWTRRVTGPDGEDRLLCSLCGPDLPLDQDDPPEATWTPANNGRVRESRQEVTAKSDADESAERPMDKDAVIASLQERLARAEARNQELTRELAELRASTEPGPPEPAASLGAGDEVGAPALAAAAVTLEAPIDSSEPGERTWGETPAEFAAELAAAASGEGGEPALPDDSAADLPSPAFEDTQPLPVVEAQEGEPEEEIGPGAPEIPALAVVAVEDEPLLEEPAAEAPAEQPADEDLPAEGLAADGDLPEQPEPTSADAEAEVAALALLQRGVDLFNVSRVPRKIAETNEQLGMPGVHAEPDEAEVALTFMWSMGWYRFVVDTDSSDVKLADRGYDEITNLSANARVRADGTVQLAPAQISRAAAQRIQDDHAAPSRTDDRQPGEPETPSVAAQKPPEILSKSLLGQRSDDAPAAWEKAQARDFDWER
jgi:hypothetical protein